ncbi:36592_t:CDS:1, partial [Racocetra persica]
SSGMIIPLGMEFEDSEVTLLAEQLQQITVAAEHETPQNKQEKKLNQIYIEEAQREIDQFRKQVIEKDNTKKKGKGKAKSLNITFNQQESKVKSPKMRIFIKTQLSQLDRILQLEKEQEDPRIRAGLKQLKQRLESMETNYKYVFQLTKEQTNEHIQEIEKVTNRKILEAETAEDKKAYLYKTISALTETKDAILWKNRDLVKDLEEEYGYATNQALALDRKDFKAMEEYEQRILIERLARQMELSGSEPLRQQLQAKYRELLGVSLENLDKMHDVEDEEEQIFQKQIQ